MNNFWTILGVILVVIAISWGASISWSNPDMTQRRMWLEYPGQLAGATLLMIVGALAFYGGSKDK